MPLLEYLSIPFSSGYMLVGSIGGLVFFILIIWFLIKRSEGGRTSLELEEIKEDKQLFAADEKILKEEKDEKFQAANLLDLFLKLHKRADKLGFRVNDRILHLNRIIMGLKIVKGEKISATREESLIEQINNNINFYLNNFPAQDKKILKWITKIREIQAKLYGEIREEVKDLGDEKAILEKKLKEIEAEKAA